jgi:hypothetical protein
MVREKLEERALDEGLESHTADHDSGKFELLVGRFSNAYGELRLGWRLLSCEEIAMGRWRSAVTRPI